MKNSLISSTVNCGYSIIILNGTYIIYIYINFQQAYFESTILEDHTLDESE